eukprot:15382265-Alexandrium_andersonii.AAC.1
MCIRDRFSLRECPSSPPWLHVPGQVEKEPDLRGRAGAAGRADEVPEPHLRVFHPDPSFRAALNA